MTGMCGESGFNFAKHKNSETNQIETAMYMKALVISGEEVRLAFAGGGQYLMGS